jgi:cell division protein FtsX
MDDRRRTLAAITVIVIVLILVSVLVGILVSGKKVLSPVPEDNAIKIIFVSPSIVPVATSTIIVTPLPTKKP